MAVDTLQLRSLIEPVVAGLGYELWGVEFRTGAGSGTLRVYIDRGGGVTLDDCERASRQLAALLDVEDPFGGPYSLEVSSPGMDRPLLETGHYERYLGERISVKTVEKIEGRRNFTGVLEAFEQGRMIVVCEDGPMTISLREVERARLVPDFSKDL